MHVTPTVSSPVPIPLSPTYFYVDRSQRSAWGAIHPGPRCPPVSWLVSLLLQVQLFSWVPGIKLMLVRQALLPTEPFPHTWLENLWQMALRPSEIRLMGVGWALWGSSHLSQLPPGVGKPLSSPDRLLSQLLFSLYHGPRQLSFVFCLNTEWQSTNRTCKGFGLSFCKSYCIKCVVKMAEWPIVDIQRNSHRMTMDLGESLKRNEETVTPKCTGGHRWGSDGEKHSC